MISPENGIFFTTKKDIKEELNNLQNTDWFSNDNESSSIDVQGEEEISSTIKKVADAIKKREELINLLKEWLSSSTSEIQIKLAIAGSNAEIENIKAYLGDIRHRLKSNILNKSTLTLSACADIEKRLGEAEVHLWEFQQGTARLEKIIKVFYIGEESS